LLGVISSVQTTQRRDFAALLFVIVLFLVLLVVSIAMGQPLR
jgi:hypothetical protein